MLLSDSPNITSSYGKVSHYLGKYLSRRGAVVAFSGFQHQGGPVYHRIGESYLPLYNGTDMASVEKSIKDFKPQVLVHIRDVLVFTIWYPNKYTITDVCTRNNVRRVLWMPVQSDPIPQEFVDACNSEGDLVMPFTEHGKDVLVMQGVPWNKIETLPLGIDPEVYFRRDGSKPRWGLPEKPIVLGVGAGDQPRKNWPALVEALSVVRGKLDAELYLLTTETGSYTLRQFTKIHSVQGSLNLVPEYNRTWGLSEEEMADIYSTCDAFCSPSMSEGYLVPAIESVACETPAVCTDLPNVREILGDIGVFAKADKIYPTCYSEDTEIFTREGFKSFFELTYSDEVATLNPEGEIEYQRPEKIVIEKYIGQMVHIGGYKTVCDLLVTPNHLLYVKTTQRPQEGFSLIPAEMIMRFPKAHFEMKRNASWRGTDLEYFELPIVESSRPWILVQVQRIAMEAWLDFFAWWIAEGSLCHANGGYRIIISNRNEGNKEEIASIIKNLSSDLNPHIEEQGVVFHSKQIFNYLKQFGHSKEKWIPKEIKELPPYRLKRFIQVLIRGDGTISSHGSVSYYTSSRRLADDFVEMALKCGLGVNVFDRVIYGRKCIQIHLSHTEFTPTINNVAIESYDGSVCCVTVPNHVVFVKRNGKTVWSGNSYNYDHLVDPKDLGEKLLEILSWDAKKREEWRAKAREHVKGFTYDKIADRFLEVCKDKLGVE